MGPDTTAADLFDKIRRCWSWRRGTMRRAGISGRDAGAPSPPELARLTRGQGLFLWVGGTRSVQWTRPASVEGMLLSLPSGYSLVGWAGLDGTPIAEAVGRFGDALVGASRWNAETQSYERYEPGAEEPVEGMPVLRHGDALWVELSAERRWWQSGTARTEFAFLSDVAPDLEADLRYDMERVLAFFAEHYGIMPPEFSVRVDTVRGYARASGGQIQLGIVGDWARDSFGLAHEYFHVLQFDFMQSSTAIHRLPQWLVEGTASYVSALYRRERFGEPAAKLRVVWLLSSRRVPFALRDVAESPWPLASYPLGALATDWLIRRSAAARANVQFTPLEPEDLIARLEDDAYIDFFRLLPSSETWEEAFEGAFGIAIGDFHEAFEEYRAAYGPPLDTPHLADDVDEPILVFAGEIPAETKDRIQAQFDGVRALFGDRFGDPSADYTVVVAADHAAAASAAPDAFGEHFDATACALSGSDYSVEILTCDPALLSQFTWQHFTAVVERLAPIESIPTVPEGPDRRAPLWLRTGLLQYVLDAARAALAVELIADIRRSHTERAGLTVQPLRSLRTYADMDGAGWRGLGLADLPCG